MKMKRITKKKAFHQETQNHKLFIFQEKEIDLFIREFSKYSVENSSKIKSLKKILSISFDFCKPSQNMLLGGICFHPNKTKDFLILDIQENMPGY